MTPDPADAVILASEWPPAPVTDTRVHVSPAPRFTLPSVRVLLWASLAFAVGGAIGISL